MRTILMTIALAVAVAAPAHAQDLRSPDARDRSPAVGHDLRVPDGFISGSAADLPPDDVWIAGRAGWVDIEPATAPGDGGGGVDMPPAAIVLIPAFMLAALAAAVALERRRRLA